MDAPSQSEIEADAVGKEKIVEALNAPPVQPKLTVLDSMTRGVTWFMGSWIGVGVHAVWFSTWLILGLDINLLTLIVSLEAIFIGIFLLMYGNRAEQVRELSQSKKQAKALSETIADVALDRKQMQLLEEINQKLDQFTHTVPKK